MPTFDLVIDAPPGIGTMPIQAESSEAAWARARELFPNCRLALVARDDESLHDPEG